MEITAILLFCKENMSPITDQSAHEASCILQLNGSWEHDFHLRNIIFRYISVIANKGVTTENIQACSWES